MMGYPLINFTVKGKKTQEAILAGLYILLASAFGLRLVLYPASQLVPILGLMLTAIIIMWRPVIGTALYFLVYPMVPQSESINMLKFSMLLLTVFLFAIWLWQKLRARDHVWNRLEYRWLFLFFVYLCFSPLLGVANGFTVLDWARDIAPLLNLLLIPMLVEQFNEKKNRYLILLLSILVLLGLSRDLLYLLSRYLPIPTNLLQVYRYGLTTFHIGVILCAGIMLYLNRVKPRSLWLVATLITLGCVLLTITRTIWLSAMFNMGLLAFLYSKFRKTSLMVMAISMIGITWFYFAPSEQSVTLKSYGKTGSWWSVQTERFYGARKKDIAIMNRNIEFKQAGEKFLSSPLYGMGFGYIYRFWRYHVSGKGGSGFWHSNFTHNDFINILAKGGIIGFGLWLIMLITILKKLFELREEYKDSRGGLLPTLAIIAVLNALFVGTSTPVFQTREAMFFLATIVGLGLSRFELKAENA